MTCIPEQHTISNFGIAYEVERIFHQKEYSLICTERPWYNNPFKLNKTIYGLEVPKNEVNAVATVLDLFGIHYLVRDGKYLNTNGCWTKKSFDFIEIPNHENAYWVIYNKKDEIPMCGDVNVQ